MNPVESWHAETLGREAVSALAANGFDAVYAPTPEDAVVKAASYFKSGCTVGFGGSMTVKALGLQERALAWGCEVLDHNAPGLSQEQKLAILRRQLTCDLFISGSNALTLDGEIVNVDGTGNRVAALSFGPAKTVVIVGVNKIVRDLDEALDRIELQAAPMNNKRLSKPNPCVKTGRCMDCSGDTRICRAYHILRKRPSLSDFTVIVVGDSLGY